MIIGLVRHFKVVQPYFTNRRMNSQEFIDWCEAYDAADIEPNHCDLGGIPWEVCYASDLTRAARTAGAIFTGEIIITPLLREIFLTPFIRTRWRLPFRMWDDLGRLAWYNSLKSQTETRQITLERIHTFIDMALGRGHEHVLVVSHGGLMWFMRDELVKMGFKGESFVTAENGRLYLLEKDSQPPA